MIHNAAVLITKLDVQYVLLGVNILFKKGIPKIFFFSQKLKEKSISEKAKIFTFPIVAWR